LTLFNCFASDRRGKNSGQTQHSKDKPLTQSAPHVAAPYCRSAFHTKIEV
jgi:hypothetical protein